MRRAMCFTVFLALAASTVAARAPTLDELPTVKAIQEQATAKIEEDRRALAEAQKDPKKELIEAYASGTASIFAWKGVVDVLKGDGEQPTHRQQAAEALRQRFQNVAAADARMDKLKREIATAVLKLLNDKDPQVRIWTHAIFLVFWPGRAQAIDFKPEAANPRERYDAYKAWQKYLSGR